VGALNSARLLSLLATGDGRRSPLAGRRQTSPKQRHVILSMSYWKATAVRRRSTVRWHPLEYSITVFGA
jgi:hypothetical protein